MSNFVKKFIFNLLLKTVTGYNKIILMVDRNYLERQENRGKIQFTETNIWTIPVLHVNPAGAVFRI